MRCLLQLRFSYYIALLLIVSFTSPSFGGKTENSAISTGLNIKSPPTLSKLLLPRKQLKVQKKEDPVIKMLEVVNLTALQKQKINEVLKAYNAEKLELHETSLKNTKLMRPYLLDANYNAEKIREIAKSAGDVVTREIISRLAMKHAIMAMLTPGQKLQLKESRKHQRPSPKSR